MSLTLQREARQDLEDAAYWYETKAVGLGDEFLNEIESSFKRIKEFSESYPIVYKNLRRCVLHRFPFCVFYTVEGFEIIVLAIMHVSRDPDDWKTRT